MTGTKKNDDLSILDEGTVWGLAGNDTISYSQFYRSDLTGSFEIYAGSGNDLVEADQDEDYLRVSGDAIDPTKIEIFRATADHIYLGSGNDVVAAGGGDDSLDGSAGYDVLNYAASVIVDGGAGNLTGGHGGGSYRIRTDIDLNNKGLVVDLQKGTSTFAGAKVTVEVRNDSEELLSTTSRGGVGTFTQSIAGFEAVVGSRWSDTLKGSNRTDVIEILDVGSQSQGDTSSKIIGRGGTDVASYAWSAAGITADLEKRTVEMIGVLVAADGTKSDFTDVLSGIEGIYGTYQKDYLRGDDSDNIFTGRGGDDEIDGRGGFDTVTYDTGPFGAGLLTGPYYGATEVPFANSGFTAVTVNLGKGTATDDWGFTDELISIERVIGTPLDDTLIGSKGRNTLEGGNGNDNLDGGKGADALNGGNGDDIISGGGGWDIIKGGQGLDKIAGGAGRDLIFGDNGPKAAKGAGNDIISGNDGMDKIYGYKGKDQLNGDGDDDTLYGGDDNDTLNGGRHDDLLYGERGDDKLFGGKHKDTLDGGAGDDLMDGGAGNDTFIPGTGVDIMRGGGGKDTLDLTTAKSKVTIDLGANDFDGGGFGRNTIRDIEVIFGSAQKEVITGSNAQEEFYGGAGQDTLDGAGGKDTISGGLDKDTVRGGSGDDELYGGKGNDLLEGGAGDDELSGNGGNDILRGGAGKDTLDGGVGRDKLTGGGGDDTFVFSRGGTTIVTDFNLDDDTIDLSGRGFATQLLARAAFTPGVGHNAELTIGTDKIVLMGIDVNGLLPYNFDI